MNNNESTHISILDIQEWIEKIKEKDIREFELRQLPKELQRKSFIGKAKEEGLIKSIRKVNGRHIWRIVDGTK